MIVSLEELKRVLGIDLTNTDEDANLTRLIQAKTTWVEGETRRRFDTPISRTEYHSGTDESFLYLEGYVDDSIEADNPSELLDPTTSVQVAYRSRVWPSAVWEDLIEGTDWERRSSRTLVALSPGGVWSRCDEFRIVYLDGYANAPEDIKELVIELAIGQYWLDVQASQGATGITSETLGDYSYSTDLAAIVAGMGSVSENGSKTIQRYKRKFA